jgi:succinate dehydrogenase/fumarate reductase flavoprotein subunit
MAGLAAAAHAAQEGASVVLVEKTAAVGGSAAYAGFIWTAPTVEVMHEVNRDADPVLAAKVVEDYARAIDWVGSLGVDLRDPVTVLRYGRGRGTDMANLLLTCSRVVQDSPGGEVLLSTQTERLLIEDGRVLGAEVRASGGERRQIRARSTLLATGGFGGDPELRAVHIHPQAREMPLRANLGSTGDGLRLGLSAGAAFGPENAGFYGHLIPSRVSYDNPLEFVDLTFYHSEHGVMLNLDGGRFWDETIGDHITPLALIEQPEARALLIYDQHVHDEWMMKAYVKGTEPLDKFQLAYRRGARCAIAHELDEFGDLPEEWGYPGSAVLQSLQQFNRQCQSGRPDPARLHDARPLTEPPFYVIEVVPAITFTFGGLLIDPQARVLDEQRRPIRGLLAAGADSGGVFVRGYAGGIANALIFGLQAAATALASAAPVPATSAAT